VADVSEIEVGRDSLVAQEGSRRGLLLPQVPTERQWDRETFLSHTCLKAGLRPNAWRTGAKISRFQAEVFSEQSALTQRNRGPISLPVLRSLCVRSRFLFPSSDPSA
jgi:uncharacterized protein (TIGR00296 family)